MVRTTTKFAQLNHMETYWIKSRLSIRICLFVVFRTQITAHLAYSASSNTNIQHHMNSAYFQYNHAHIAWYAASSVSAEWAQLTFSTVYDVSYIRYRVSLYLVLTWFLSFGRLRHKFRLYIDEMKITLKNNQMATKIQLYMETIAAHWHDHCSC